MKSPVRFMFVAGIIIAVACVVAACKSNNYPPFESYAPTLPSTELPPKTLHARFFGTTTILISDGATSIMVDGFFSRPGLLRVLRGLGRIQSDYEQIDYALEKGNVGSIHVLLVAHSHHDHAMDAPAVARRYGALLVSSDSTRNIAAGMGLRNIPFRAIVHGTVLPREHSGGFTIRFFESPHAPHKLKFMEQMLAGTIDEPLYSPAYVWQYKLGHNYTFLLEHDLGNILIVASANVGLQLGDKKAAVVFLSIGNMDLLSNKKVNAYWQEAVINTGAKLVIPVHWDDFRYALNAPLKPFPYFVDDTACSMETIKFLAGDKVAVRFMPLFDPVLLSGTSARTAQHSATAKSRDPFTEGCRKGRPERD
jgi:L-ascorbate metabolism protein UlaG (beta-lactamase superfamily)